MLDVIRNSTTYSLDDGTLCYLKGYDGLGMSPLRRLVEQGPLQHGATDRGFRLQPRTIVLALKIVADSLEDLYDKRSQLLTIFAPSDTVNLQLRWTIGAVVRQIDCHCTELLYANPTGFAQRIAVSLLCPDPTFYNPTGEGATFVLGGGGTALTIPLAVPMVVGASTLDATVVVEHDGNWDSAPIVRITGPITDPVLTNETTGEVLDFTGTTIAAGDWYEVDTRYGEKTVVDSAGANVIADLTDDSDLATFHLQTGTNSLNVTGTAATEATSVSVVYYERFLGV